MLTVTLSTSREAVEVGRAAKQIGNVSQVHKSMQLSMNVLREILNHTYAKPNSASTHLSSRPSFIPVQPIARMNCVNSCNVELQSCLKLGNASSTLASSEILMKMRQASDHNDLK